MVTSSTQRVPDNTAFFINQEIERQSAASVLGHAADGPEAISRRLDELEHEWDIERTMQAEAAIMTMLGLTLGATVHRRFFALPALVAGMVLLHAIQGWYPLLPAFRRLKLRTADEINRERFALKAMRGDFQNVSTGSSEDSPQNAEATWQATKK